MPEKENQNLDKIIEDQIKYIYDRYETKSKTFFKLLTGLITFALLFFVLIFFPYISIQHERQRLDRQAGLQKERISQKTLIIEAFEQSIEGIEKLRKEIRNGPDNLRAYILSLERVSENTD